MSTKITVIHHSADFDGIFCREIARKFLGDSAAYIGWDFSDQPLPIPDGRIYILDLPVDAVFGFKYKPEDVNGKGPQQPVGLIWIDHHKSSIATHPSEIEGYRIDGVAACRLAWQWFQRAENPAMEVQCVGLPEKQAYIDRAVCEPDAVQLAGEYDIWDKRNPDAEVFQFGLRSEELTADRWRMLLDDTVHPTLAGTGMEQTESELICQHLISNGHLLQRYQQSNDAGMMHRSFIVEFEGLKFLALSTARCNSLTFASKDVHETGHDALMGFYFNGKTWTVSMYHAKHNTGIDLSRIASKYSGGGHRGACGFTAEYLPFIQNHMAQFIAELQAYLNGQKINSENIGSIRRSLCMPWDTRWNSVVRDETAWRENK